MSQQNTTNNAPHIQSINFHDQGIEIIYAEPQDIERLGETGILRTRIVMCPAQHVEGELRELIDAAAELLDRILVIERNPSPPTFRR